MKPCLVAALSALFLVSAAHAQGPVVTETVRLTYIGAKDALAKVEPIQGIDAITCDFKTNSLSISGSHDAVELLKAAIKRTDILPTIYRIDVKIVRFQVDAHGKYTEDVAQAPILHTVANVAGSAAVTSSLGGIAVSATPVPGSDKNTTTLSVELQELGEQGEVVKSGKNVRSVNLGLTVRITGMTDATDKTVRRAVQRGEIVKGSGAYSGYYVEVTPTVELANVAGGS